MQLQHVIYSQQFTVPLIMELFDRTGRMTKIVARGGTKDYENKIMASLFYSPSTRTDSHLNPQCIVLAAKSYPQNMLKNSLQKLKEKDSRIPSKSSVNTAMSLCLGIPSKAVQKKLQRYLMCILLMPAMATMGNIRHRPCWIYTQSIMNAKHWMAYLLPLWVRLTGAELSARLPIFSANSSE